MAPGVFQVAPWVDDEHLSWVAASALAAAGIASAPVATAARMMRFMWDSLRGSGPLRARGRRGYGAHEALDQSVRRPQRAARRSDGSATSLLLAPATSTRSSPSGSAP